MCLKGKAGDFGEACPGGDHGRRPVCERRVREEGEGADRWGHGVSDRASNALRGPRALERRAGKRAMCRIKNTD